MGTFGSTPDKELIQTEPGQRLRRRGIVPVIGMVAWIAGLMVAAGVLILSLTGRGSERRDFVSFWAAGQQLTHHQNPYDAEGVLRLERTLGFPAKKNSLIMRNPPTALLLVAPLGFLGFRAGAVLWALLLIACLVASGRMLWILNGRPGHGLTSAGYGFGPFGVCLMLAPALACVLFGQTGLFALLGLVLFLRLHGTRPLLAGMSLWLCAAKPHLFLPLGCVIFLWVVIGRRYWILAGAVLALAISSAAAVRFDSLIWVQYSQMMHSIGIEREFIPCISIALRFGLDPNSLWLQYLPAAAGCLWALGFFWRRRDGWDWIKDGPLLILVSLLVAPYAWLTDQAIAIPALLGTALRTNFTRLVLLALVSVAIELEVLCGVTMHSPRFLWTTVVWVGWYFYAQSPAGTSTSGEPSFTSPSASPLPPPRN